MTKVNLTFYCLSSLLNRFLRYNLILAPIVYRLIDTSLKRIFSTIKYYFEEKNNLAILDHFVMK